MQLSTTISAWMELVHSDSWVQAAIPEFFSSITLLHKLVQANYSEYGANKKALLVSHQIFAQEYEHEYSVQWLIQ